MLDSVSSRSAPLTALDQRKPVSADPAVSAATAATATGSARAATAGDIARKLSQSAPVDVSRVSELRQAMQAGNFPVQADRIADAMIASLKA